MVQFDPAVRSGTIVTAGDEFRVDIGVRDGRIVEDGHTLIGGGAGALPAPEI